MHTLLAIASKQPKHQNACDAVKTRRELLMQHPAARELLMHFLLGPAGCLGRKVRHRTADVRTLTDAEGHGQM